MDPELLARLRALIKAPTDATRQMMPPPVEGPVNPDQPYRLPTRDIYAPAPPRETPMTVGPSTRTASVGDPRGMSGGRLAAELATGLIPGPVGVAPDVARAVQSARQGDAGETAANLGWAGLGLIPFGKQAGRATQRLSRSLFGTHEAIPGAGTQHLQGLLSATPQQRAMYSAEANWRTPKDVDALYEAAGLAPQPTLSGTGLYTPPGAAVPEMNPLEIARANIPNVPDPERTMNTIEGVRALLDAQNAGAWHSVTAGPGTGARIPLAGPASSADLTALNDIAQGWHGGAVDTGAGVTLLGPLYPGASATPRAMLGRVNPILRNMQLSGRPYIADTAPQGYLSLFEDGFTGGGEATRRALGNADPQVLSQLESSPDVVQAIRDRLARDAQWTGQMGPENPAITYARTVAGRPGGLMDLYRRMQAGDPMLPALGLLTGGGALAYDAAQEEEGDGSALPGASMAGLGLSLLMGGPTRARQVWRNRPQDMNILPITPRDIAEANNPNLQRFLGSSVLQTPEGVPLRVVHGTGASGNFSAFKDGGPYQLGTHVTRDPRAAQNFSTYLTTPESFAVLNDPNTPEQIRRNLEQSGFREHGRSIPLYGRFENPLRLPDLGSWSPKKILGGLQLENPELAERLRPGLSQIPEGEASALRNFLEGEGFDSIIYRNRYEGVPKDVFDETRRFTKERQRALENIAGPYNVPAHIPQEFDWRQMWPDQPDTYIALRPNQLKSAVGNVGTYSRNTNDILRSLALMLGAGAAGQALPVTEDPNAP
jgi:hypothetical protein